MPTPAAQPDDIANGAVNRIRDRLIREFRARRPTRAGSLVISVFGDAIAPHGGTVWLGSLIEALAPFGISQRAVRTAVFRLANDGWLESRQIGRRSYYRPTRDGRQRFAAAARRIYAEPRRAWDGRWHMVLVAGVDGARRDTLRRELGWQGFAPFSPSLLAHPSPDPDTVRSLLDALDPENRALLLEGRVDEYSREQLAALVADAWSLDELAERYRGFLARFRPLLKALDGTPVDPATAFQLRVLLVHEYRKILLRDPRLPDELLPAEWDGIAAFQLARNSYARLAGAAERYLTTEMVTADGPLPPPDPAFFQRFGGLSVDGGLQ